MKRKYYLLLLLVIILAFWQVFFLQNGMKWDFTDAFLPSRYFFSESILSNQFPLWNPYLLYGTPVYADMVSVFNPEFWIIGNMFGYSNITLQLMYLVYIFVAGVSFLYFLKQFNTEHKLSVGLSIAYMLSGLSIGNAQHLAFVSGYAIIPFVLASYFIFIRHINKPNFIRLSIALFLSIYSGYPGLTIITGYFILTIFIYYLIVNRTDKSYIKKLFIYHFGLVVIVILFSSVLILAYTQISPFLSRFSGLPMDLAQKHPFTFKSVLSFILPMAAGNDTHYFGTDVSMSNGYWGIISLILFLFSLIKKAKNRESYLILFFGVFSLFASFGDQLFLRGLLYNFAPLMDMFKYPSIFRAFFIFSFLAFIGINFNLSQLSRVDKKRLIIISGLIITVILFLIWQAVGQTEHFAFFNGDKSFVGELSNSTRFDNIILQGVIQTFILIAFILMVWKIKTLRYFSAALLFLFVIDGIISTQLNIHYTVINKTSPVKFSRYLNALPKGFPIPELNPIGENSDRNAQNEFVWMNNNVFPKKVTFDGLVAFKLDGYRYLADNHPELLDAIKKEAVVYFSDDIREDSIIEDFKTNTIFLQTVDYKYLQGEILLSDENDKLEISDFSPQKIEIKTITNHPQLLIYQQNIYNGWKVYIDGKRQNLIKSNFTHLSVFLPSGEHTVLFEYTNPAIKYTFYFTVFILLILVAFSIHYFIIRHPHKKKHVVYILVSCILLFIISSSVHRYFYAKNKLGLTPVIIEKTEQWKKRYNNDIRILLSTHNEKLKELEYADTVCYIDEKTNQSELSRFLMNSESKYFAFAWQGSIISNNLFELIYSFYPTLIEQEKNNNSGIILLEKSTKQQNYLVFRNFEPENPQTSPKNSSRIMVDSVSGNHTYFYDVNDKYGMTIKIPTGKNLGTPEKISIITDLMIEDEITKILLVVSTKRAGKQQLYKVSEINKFASQPNRWARAAFVINLKNDIQEGDLINIYFWNINRARFQIDNLKIKFSYSE